MNLLRRLWKRRPWRPKRAPNIIEQWTDRLTEDFYESVRPGARITWNEITLEPPLQPNNLREGEDISAGIGEMKIVPSQRNISVVQLKVGGDEIIIGNHTGNITVEKPDPNEFGVFSSKGYGMGSKQEDGTPYLKWWIDGGGSGNSGNRD